MSATNPGLDELRLGDLSTFLAVHRAGSVTSAAREVSVTPSQVSKAIARLEHALKARLFSRGARSVTLTAAGRALLPQIEEAVARVDALRSTDVAPGGELTLAAPSYILFPLLPRIIECLPRKRVRGVALSAPLLRTYATEGLFDVLLVPGSMQGLPPRWAGAPIGELRSALLATPALARTLGPWPSNELLRTIAFVAPIAHNAGTFVAVEDDCPLAHADRTVGARVDTLGLALEVASCCQHLVFGPIVAAQRQLGSGELVEVRVRGWNVRAPLFLACDSQRVLAREQAAIEKVTRALLAEAP